MRIDAHQHFWALDQAFTNWPTPDLAAIYRDYSASDLKPHLLRGSIDGTVLVQAAPSVAETLFLLEIADSTPFVKGVVGWVDFAAADALVQLDRIATHPALKGVRPMLQSIEQQGWILDPSFAQIFARLTERDLCFDALVRADQIAEIGELAASYPALKIVVDHGGKPDIAGGGFGKWADDLRALSLMPNCHCKLSGLWTEAGGNIAGSTIQPYADYILDCFGPERTLWGSDWPVVELAGSYEDWLAQCELFLNRYSQPEKAAILGGNAARFYRLSHD